MMSLPRTLSLCHSLTMIGLVIVLVILRRTVEGFTGISSKQLHYNVIPSPRQLVRSPLLHSSADSEQECSLDEGEASGECLEHKGYVADPFPQPFMQVSQVYVAPVESLRETHPSFHSLDDEDHSNVIKFSKKREAPKHSIHHPLYGNSTMGGALSTNGDDSEHDKPINSHASNLEYNSLVAEDELVLVDTVRKPGMQSLSRAFHRAGPRKLLHFDPTTVNAAIVTCGGLCPGLNNVIRELVHSLTYLYGAKTVWYV